MPQMQHTPRGHSGSGPGESYDGAPEGERRGFSPFNFLFGFGVGTFVGVGLALLAFAMVDEEPPPRATVRQPDAPVLATSTAAPAVESRPRAKTALDVRLGPGNGFAVVGVLAKGDSVEVTGRDDAGEWLAIRFPPGSSGRGWIPVTSVDEPPDVTRLAVLLPTPLPRTISTFPPGAFNDGERQGTGASIVPTRTPDPNATPELRPGPADLVVTAVRLLPDRRISVTVANRGPNDLVGFTIFVVVRDLGARSEQLSLAIPFLRVGATATLQTTSLHVTGEEVYQAIVDPFGSAPDVDRTNNSFQVTLVAPTPTPTVTPTPNPLD
ncbi:MAG TPA: SH3 domain-containing protein [Dehalococcoidia bacterium]|nr:SH3 domain-containing protein [Dehalococcoidia bacterium]